MGNILIVAEIQGGQIREASYELAAFAQKVSGASDVVELQTPCLVAVQSGLNQVRYASLKGIMAAKKKPLDVKTVADLGLGGQVGAGAAKIKIEKIAPPPKGDKAEILEGSPGEIASSLVNKIKELGLL